MEEEEKKKEKKNQEQEKVEGEEDETRGTELWALRILRWVGEVIANRSLWRNYSSSRDPVQ